MALVEYISASRDAMSLVRQVIEKRDWQQLDTVVEFYRESFARLQHYLERFGADNANEAEKSGMRQLDIMHRKVMRQLSQHMRHTKEDMETIGRLLH